MSTPHAQDYLLYHWSAWISSRIPQIILTRIPCLPWPTAMGSAPGKGTQIVYSLYAMNIHSSRRPCSKAEIPLSLPTCVMYWETNPTARNIHPIRQSLDKWSGWSVQKRQISIQDHYVILMTIDRSMH